LAGARARACDAGAALALVPPPLLLLLLRTFIQQRAAAAEAAACVVAVVVGYVDGSQSSDLRNGRGNFDALREIS